MQVAGCSALVTGGASGLGLGTVHALVAAGARVVLLDLPSSDGKAVAERLGSAVTFVATDVCDPDQVTAAVRLAAASDEFPFRVVVNCAGMGGPTRILTRSGPHPLDVFEHMVAVNLTGTFNVVRLAAEQMARVGEEHGERGVIVNTASIAGLDGPKYTAAYAAAKAGVIGMTLPLARDLAGLKIRVLTIAPGTFATPLYASVPDEGRASLEGSWLHPARAGEPAEFAALVMHMIANPMLNGETVRLDAAVRAS
jgi:NAD(P)-dependent dehydrogenase (short-subunit alcohol dehydrogenase family)